MSPKGRPPTDDENPRNKTTSCRVSEEVLLYLREFGTKKIEDTIRKTKHFKEWQGQNANRRTNEG